MLDEEGVERGVGLDATERVVGLRRGGHLGQQLAGRGLHLGCQAPLAGQAHRQPVDDLPDLVHLPQLGRRDGDDLHRPVVVGRAQQPLVLEDAECLPQGSTADAELSGQVDLEELRAGGQLPQPDGELRQVHRAGRGGIGLERNSEIGRGESCSTA